MKFKRLAPILTACASFMLGGATSSHNSSSPTVPLPTPVPMAEYEGYTVRLHKLFTDQTTGQALANVSDGWDVSRTIKISDSDIVFLSKDADACIRRVNNNEKHPIFSIRMGGCKKPASTFEHSVPIPMDDYKHISRRRASL